MILRYHGSVEIAPLKMKSHESSGSKVKITKGKTSYYSRILVYLSFERLAKTFYPLLPTIPALSQCLSEFTAIIGRYKTRSNLRNLVLHHRFSFLTREHKYIKLFTEANQSYEQLNLRNLRK
jgi:hypothetical protein